MRTPKMLAIPILVSISLMGCGGTKVVEPDEDTIREYENMTFANDDTSIAEDTVTTDSIIDEIVAGSDTSVDSDTSVNSDSAVVDGDTIVDNTTSIDDDTSVSTEDVSKFAEYDMLEVMLDGIPFTIGNSLSDFISNLSIIDYRISANTRNRNLSAGQSLEIPIVAKDDRTIGYLTISNNDKKKHSMRTSPVTELTIIPDAVLSVSAFGLNQSSSYEDTKFILGEPDTAELTSVLYESEIGKLYCTYTANGDITGITVIAKEVD